MLIALIPDLLRQILRQTVRQIPRQMIRQKYRQTIRQTLKMNMKLKMKVKLILKMIGTLNYDEETGYIYDEEGDVVDEDTIAGFCEGDGKGDDEDE